MFIKSAQTSDRPKGIDPPHPLDPPDPHARGSADKEECLPKVPLPVREMRGHEKSSRSGETLGGHAGVMRQGDGACGRDLEGVIRELSPGGGAGWSAGGRCLRREGYERTAEAGSGEVHRGGSGQAAI